MRLSRSDGTGAAAPTHERCAGYRPRLSARDLLLLIEGNPLANINLAAGFRLSSHRDDRGNRQQCFCFSQDQVGGQTISMS
jgi:hypothetical protein